jgi:hypothetical protein
MKQLKQKAPFVLGAALLALCILVGQGFTEWSRLVSMEPKLQYRDFTYIPYLALGVLVAGALLLMGAARPLPRESPYSLLPALALGLLVCVLTGTPVVWSAFSYAREAWIIPYAGLYAYALLLLDFLRLLFDGKARALPFDAGRAARWAGLVMLFCLPGLLRGVLYRVEQAVAAARPDAADIAYFAQNYLSQAIMLASGWAGWWAARRGRRAAGIVLTGTASLAIAAYLIVNYVIPRVPDLEQRLISTPLGVWLYAGNAFRIYRSLSAFSFCLFAGLKCLSRERAH